MAEADPSVPKLTAEITPLLKAALSILAIDVFRDLGLPAPTARAVINALSVGKSRTYELARTIEGALPELHRPVGRPAASSDGAPPDTALLITTIVRDFLIANPGVVVSGDRNSYGTAFRLFATGLMAPGGHAHGEPVGDVAQWVGVPEDTLRDWLRQPRSQPQPPAPTTSPLGTSVAAQVVALYKPWQGPLTAFRAALLQHHRIDMSMHLLRSLLELSGDRQPKRRAKRDPEAIRGALERFFPGAQLMADGKHLVVELNGVSYPLNWELVVDADTGAHLGFDVSSTEDGQALIDAVDMAVETIGEAPLAVLADNKPSNHSDQVQQAMDENDTLLMASTAYRPENKSTVEGAFGLFSQTMPNIALSSCDSRELVEQVMFWVLFAYCAGRNQAPQTRRKGKSATQLFDEREVTEEDADAAKRRLREINERILARRDAERLRQDPVVRSMMVREFNDLGLSDPEGHFVGALTRVGLGPALEAVAIFRAKLNAKTLPDDAIAERYLLGIAYNVAEREQDLFVYYELLRLRTEAHDLLLEPLLDELKSLAGLSTIELIDAVLRQLSLTAALVDRRFWMARLVAAFKSLDAALRLRHGPWLARQVAALFSLPRTDRDSLIASLAAATVA